MASSPPPPKNRARQKQILRGLVLLPAAAAIFAAVWISAEAIVENIRFARTTDQILHLVAATHNVASIEPGFAARPGEDLLGELAHAGLISGTTEGKPVALENSWNNYIIAIASAPSVMRIETTMPARDCRRLALFFVKNGEDIGLNIMEAHEDSGKVWRRFYDRTSGLSAPGNQSVESACGEAPQVTLALILSLR